LPVSVQTDRFLEPPFSGPAFVQVHPSVAFLLLRVPSRSSPAEIFRPPPTYLGFVPLRDITGARPLVRRMPSLRFVPSSGFLNLATVCSGHRLCELVPSRSHVQGSLRSGASLSAQPRSLSRAICPHAVGVDRSSHRRLRTHTKATDRAPRLRGFVPREAALPAVRGLAVPPLAPLFGFVSSRSSTSARAPVPQSHPLSTVPHRPSSAFFSGGLDFEIETNLLETFEPFDRLSARPLDQQPHC
jgi:hypothetical protein